MQGIFEQDVKTQIQSRIDNLKPTAQRLWGKMDVSQMLAHCSAALEVAVGDKKPPRIFIGRILGPFIKPVFLNEKPLKRNTPTDKSFVMTGQKDYEKEKRRLKQLINRFADEGAANCTTHPHSFFGKLTAEEWSIGTFKHLDHHLRQFGA